MKALFLNNHLATNGFLQPGNGGIISADAPHLTVQSSRALATCSGLILRPVKCLWEPVYHGITLGWEAPHHFLYTSQRDEMVLTSAQQVSLRTPSLEPPTTTTAAGNLAHRRDLTSRSENTPFPDTRWRPSGSPPNTPAGHISAKKKRHLLS